MSITTNHHLSVGRADTCRESPSLLHSPRSELSFELWDLNPILKRNIFWSQYIFSENYILHFFLPKIQLKKSWQFTSTRHGAPPPKVCWFSRSLGTIFVIFQGNYFHHESLWNYISRLLKMKLSQHASQNETISACCSTSPPGRALRTWTCEEIIGSVIVTTSGCWGLLSLLLRCFHWWITLPNIQLYHWGVLIDGLCLLILNCLWGGLTGEIFFLIFNSA